MLVQKTSYVDDTYMDKLYIHAIIIIQRTVYTVSSPPTPEDGT